MGSPEIDEATPVTTDDEAPIDHPAQSDAGQSKPSSLWDKIRKARRRRWMVLAAVVLGLGVAGWLFLSLGQTEIDTEQQSEVSPADRFAKDCETLLADPDATRLLISDYPINDQLVQRIESLTKLKTLVIDQGELTDQSIPVIAKLPKLNHLRIRLSAISDVGLEELATCESLQILNLPHANCTAVGVAQLSKLPKLLELRLGSPALTNDVVRSITQIQSLRSVHLIDIPVTNEGLKQLAAMPRLETLYLDGSAVTEAGWDWLFAHHSHLHVHIDQQHHDRDPQRHEHH